MRKTALATAVAGASLLGAAPSQAVWISADDTGDVLMYPYYNVLSGNQTFFTVTNTSPYVQVVKVRFREGVGSEDVFDFQLWLSPYDQWSAVVQQIDGTVNVATEDTSCTVPAIRGNIGQARFSDARVPSEYTGDRLSRISEGHFEIIGMASVTGALAAAATHTSSGEPANCDAVVGFNNRSLPILTTTTTAGSTFYAPDDVLYGNVAVFNPTSAVWFPVESTPISDFARSPLFWPQNAQPCSQPACSYYTGDVTLRASFGGTLLNFDLPDLTTPDLGEDGPGDSSIANVYVGGAAVAQATFNNPGTTTQAGIDAVAAWSVRDSMTIAIDAISATNDYITSSGFETDMVFTFPGRYAYTFPESIVGVDFVAPPFTTFEDRATGQACEVIDINLTFDREENQVISSDIGFSPGVPTLFQLCYEVNVVSVNSSDSVLASETVRSQVDLPSGFENGWMRLGFQNFLLQDDNGVNFAGLPFLGFAAYLDSSGDINRGGTFATRIVPTSGLLSVM
jgi:hypothetical protein